MARIIAFANQKGGVGKTTLAFHLAKAIAEGGQRVLAVDNDPQGNLTESLLNLNAELEADISDIYKGAQVVPQNLGDNLDLIGSNIRLATAGDGDFDLVFRLREGLADLVEEYDVVIVDSLPSLGTLQLAALTVATDLLIPVKPSKWSFTGLGDLLDTVGRVQKRTNPRLNVAGIVLNQIDPRKVVLERQFEEALREEYPELIFSNVLHKRVAFDETCTQGVSMHTLPASDTARKEFEAFYAEFRNKIGGE